MKFVTCVRLLATLIAVAVAASLASSAHALEWFDDFNDGDAEDGNPVMWTPFTDFLPGDYDASSGDYVLTPIDPFPMESLLASVNDVVFGDTYARTLAFVESPSSDVGNVGLIIRFDPVTASGYIGVLDNGGNGVLTLSRIEFGAEAERYPQVNLDPITAATDVMIELSAVGDQLSLTAWEPGQPKPDPQIEVTDSTFSTGPAGIIFTEDANNTAGVFRWAAAQDVPFPVISADFDEDGDVDGDDFLLWQGGFGTLSGAEKMDGDYDNDGDVDGDDFLGWQDEFGSGDGAGSAAVPEPAGAVLATMLALVAGFGLRRRRA